MEFKGTKTEWHAVDYAGTYYLLDGKYYEDKNILDSECVGEDVAKANAQLAVSSPEMLKMLQELLKNKSFISHLPTTAHKVRMLVEKVTI